METISCPTFSTPVPVREALVHNALGDFWCVKPEIKKWEEIPEGSYCIYAPAELGYDTYIAVYWKQSDRAIFHTVENCFEFVDIGDYKSTLGKQSVWKEVVAHSRESLANANFDE